MSIGRSLVAELLQDGGPKFVAVDRLRQVYLKARRSHARALRVGRDQGDGRHRPSEADVEMPKLGEEFAPGRFGRCEVAHDDIGDERGSNRVVGTGGGDERARDLEHRPKEVARELIVLDHQDVNPSKFRRRSSHLVCFRALQDSLHVTRESVVGVPREPEWPRRVSDLSLGVFRRDGAPGLSMELLGELHRQQPNGLQQVSGGDGQID